MIGDRLFFPIQTISEKGKTSYNRSKAQKWLKQATKEGKPQDKMPLHLKQKVLSLQPFTLKQIASYTYRDKLYQKEDVYWQKMRGDKARKKQEKLEKNK